MAVEYFGNNVNGTSTTGLSGFSNINDGINIVYTCPGTGNMEVKELGMRCYMTSGSANFRIAIYDTSNNFVAQGSAEINITHTSAAWASHTTFTNQAGGAITPILTGGTEYKLVATADGSNLVAMKNAVTSGYCKWDSKDYTGGFPATISITSNSGSQPCVRCGVESASSGLSIPLVQGIYRRRR